MSQNDPWTEILRSEWRGPVTDPARFEAGVQARIQRRRWRWFTVGLGALATAAAAAFLMFTPSEPPVNIDPVYAALALDWDDDFEDETELDDISALAEMLDL